MNAKLKIVLVFFATISSSVFGGARFPVKAVGSVKAYDDVRWKDLSGLDLSEHRGLLKTLRFNEETIWPVDPNMPEGWPGPEELFTAGLNPGLGVRSLHEQGIMGKGVTVAIIDQPLFTDHPEYDGKIIEYFDAGCGGSEGSMHGPAVASLLVGTNCGTAPGAKVYYAAAPSWKKDAMQQAKALNWIIEKNKTLSGNEKIRVVSVSAAPSGAGSPFDKNNKMWDKASARAKAAGILVLDCTSHLGFIGPCWYNQNDPENAAKCTPGFPGREAWFAKDKILVPTSPRTYAEQYNENEFAYTYGGKGGLSWAIPYCAGVLAMGWQVNPELTAGQMKLLLLKSALKGKGGAKIIYPERFIDLVKRTTSDFEINTKQIVSSEPKKRFKRKTRKSIIDNKADGDPDVIGTWKSVDFVKKMEEFTSGKKNWGGKLFLKKIKFNRNGTTDGPWSWKKGKVYHPGDKTTANYHIKEMDGSMYMFFEWMSGDVTIRGMKPMYYVLKKTD